MKCVCKKTHLSGKNHFIIDQNYEYWVNDMKPVQVVYDEWIRVPANYRVVNTITKESNLYLPNDFAQHFIGIAELRELKLSQILD